MHESGLFNAKMSRNYHEILEIWSYAHYWNYEICAKILKFTLKSWNLEQKRNISKSCRWFCLVADPLFLRDEILHWWLLAIHQKYLKTSLIEPFDYTRTTLLQELLSLFFARVSHRSSANRCFRTPVHKNYEAYELQFCMIITLDHLHPAHQVLWNSIKDCGFGEPISGCPNRMTFQPKVWIFGQQLPKLSTSTDFNET